MEYFKLKFNNRNIDYIQHIVIVEIKRVSLVEFTKILFCELFCEIYMNLSSFSTLNLVRFMYIIYLTHKNVICI